MRMLSYVFETSLTFSESVSDHSFVLRCLPKSTNTQKVMESQVFTHPRIALTEQVDGFGNRIIVGYCPQDHDSFDFYASGLAMVESENAGPTPVHPMFAQHTPLTMPDDALRAAATRWARELYPGDDVRDAASGRESLCACEDPSCGSPAWERSSWGNPSEVLALAQGLCAKVFSAFEYAPGATSVATTAAEAFASGRGVCQDYAHVLISLCRVLGVPARYVTGLMVGEGATHAWVEIHDGVRWRGLDPTHNCTVDDRYMLFATGRDFEDCPIERGVFRGNAEQTQRVSASLGDDAPAVNASTAHYVGLGARAV